MKSDDYLTEYYQNDTGDQFYPGCPASIWFQRNPEGNQFFFSQSVAAADGKNGSEKKEDS